MSRTGTLTPDSTNAAAAAMLAKIATTVDIVPGGRLDFGIGAGSRPGHPLARREYDAHGLPAQPYPASVARWVAYELIAKSL